MNKLLFSAVIASAVFAVAPTQAMPLGAIGQSVSPTSEIVVQARVTHEAYVACRHVRNRHQRHVCEQHHMHGM
jgi:hypothetical protein